MHLSSVIRHRSPIFRTGTSSQTPAPRTVIGSTFAKPSLATAHLYRWKMHAVWPAFRSAHAGAPASGAAARVRSEEEDV